jgi:DNA-binding transcriptional MerR regulator
VDIPDKLYYKIGEVAAMLELKTHVLRYWETEFSELKPVKSRTNQRLYRRKDVETALLIKDLLYQRGFTIAGARQQLKADAQGQFPLVDQLAPQDLLKEIEIDLQRIRQRLVDHDL